MLKQAFNSLLGINSRAAQLKRLSGQTIYSPCKIAHSNFFRFLKSPEFTTIRGREFVIPIDSMFGQFAQKIIFNDVPASGDFSIRYGGNDSAAIDYTDDAAAIQTKLQSVPGLSEVIVEGNFSDGFLVTFVSFNSLPSLLEVVSSTLEDAGSVAITQTIENTYSPWASKIKKGDKIIDVVYGILTIEEIIEMTDIGGDIMGFRVRCE